MTKAEIADLQTQLQGMGLYTGKIDGIWGPLTQAAYDASQNMASEGTTGLQEALGTIGILPQYSSDWTDADIRHFVTDFLNPLGIPARVAFTIAANESGAKSTALNNSGAAGLFQLMPSNQKALGFQGTPREFAQLGIQGQIPYFYRFFQGKAGQLGSIAAMYMATFTPAFLSHATDPNWVIAVKGGRDNSPWGKKSAEAAAYNTNSGFDAVKRGAIIVQDLEDAALRQAAKQKNRIEELIARAEQVQGGRTISEGGTELTQTQKSGVVGIGITMGLGYLAYHFLSRYMESKS